MLKQKNSKKQGDVGLGMAIAYFASLGWTVSIPLTDSQPYDLIVDGDGALRRVQVKTTTHKSEYGSYEVELRVLGGNQSFHYAKKFDPSLVDLIFVLTAEGRKYVIPSKEIMARSRLALGKAYDEYEIGLVV